MTQPDSSFEAEVEWAGYQCADRPANYPYPRYIYYGPDLLPGGDYDLLISSIREKLLIIPGDTIVHPGHGPESTIDTERRSNPFLQ